MRAPIVLLTLLQSPLFAQMDPNQGYTFGISASLAVIAHRNVTLTDYINAVVQPPPQDRYDEFTSGTEFIFQGDMRLSGHWNIGAEYGYFVKTYSSSSALSQLAQFQYDIQMPSLVVHYIFRGDGYWLKAGAGAGKWFGTVSSGVFQSGETVQLRSSAIGIRLHAEGHSRLSDLIYAVFAANARFANGTAFEDSNGYVMGFAGRRAELDVTSFGIMLGISLIL